MKKYFLFILNLFAAQIAMGSTAQVNDVTQISGLTIPTKNPDTFFCLHANSNSGATPVYPFLKNGTIYQTPTGTAHGFRVYNAQNDSGSTGNGFQLGSATSTLALAGTAAGSLVGPVWEFGVAETPGWFMTSGNTNSTFNFFYDFIGGAGAGTFPFVQMSIGSSMVVVCGKEF
jgi:hypothetical protein